MFVSLSVCLSVRACDSKTIAPIDLIFFTQGGVYTWLSHPLRLSGSGSGLKNLLNESSKLRDRTKYEIKDKVSHDMKRALC